MGRARGFNLMELMTATAILALLLTLGMPALAGLRQRAQISRAHHLLTASLVYARLTAVTRGVLVSVCPSSDGQNCRNDLVWEDGWIVFADPDQSAQPASPDAILRRIDPIGPDLAFRSTAGRLRIRFNPSGWASGSNISVRLCSVVNRRHLGSVIVSNAGRPRSEHYSYAVCPYSI